ncbi:peptidoglycan DD-metalloendopeptidase family protein [Glutamicibacter creatinolyticus]|uniref:peptidoglycan DD-metalloendopeptidase family protein n=1 Tax=Glutamicibacter creatinolyticus TaxID=162496 RepID=UPI0031CF1E2C
MLNQLVQHTDKIYDGTNQCLYITCHETANERVGADAQAHADLQSNGGARQASWHVQVDGKQAIRSYPDTAQCWHAGKDEGNRNSLAVEICVNADGDYDAAFKLAAEVVRDWRIKHKLGRSDVKQHNYWTGKDCPHKMRLANRWEEFLDLTEPTGKDNIPMGHMISPFEGRLTQNHWRSGGYPGHKGMDIAPPKPGQTGMPVRAAFAGTIKRICRTSQPGNKRSTWAPGRTGNGMLVANPDGEGNGYNHMTPLAGLKVGQRVEAGQLIGYNDRSGNQTGPHLHFELWTDWTNPDSDYDPQLAFKKFSVDPGCAPEVGRPSASKPAPKPIPPKDTNSKADNEAIQKALTEMGLDVGYPDGVNGPKQKAGVAAFQRNHGLVDDGYWGPKTQVVFEQNKQLQAALNKMKSTTPKLKVDGWIGAPTKARKADVLKRNRWTEATLIRNLKKVQAW